MEETFDLEVVYKNNLLQVPVRLQMQGYTYKIAAEIGGGTVLFEPDEEGAFRAVLPPDAGNDAPVPDAALLQAVATALTEALH